MRPFYGRIALCLVPCLIAGVISARAANRYLNGEGGFKLGVDLVGGTILVYEVDPQRQADPSVENAGADTSTKGLAEALKRRIDPADLYNVTIRPVGDNRVEIILPTGGVYRSQLEERQWQELLAAVQQKYPDQFKAPPDVERGRTIELINLIQQKLDAEKWQKFLAEAQAKYATLKDKGEELKKLAVGDVNKLADLAKGPDVKDEDVKKWAAETYKPTPVSEIEEFVNANYKPGQQKKDVTGEEVQRIKDLIAQVGSLEFRILANQVDDADGLRAAQALIEQTNKDPVRKAAAERRARDGLPPEAPRETFKVASGGDERDVTYQWVELGKSERATLGLDNASAEGERSTRWQEAAAARDKGVAVPLPDFGQALLYSRKTENLRLPEDERARKKFDYFLLTRVSPKDNVKVGGAITISASRDMDQGKPAVAFRFNSVGGQQFFTVTNLNRPASSNEGGFKRHLAILLDGMVVSAPSLNSAISDRGQITGNFTVREVDNLVGILRAGALPATLKPLPVSENTIGPTLGADTVRAGTLSVGVAFLAVMAFMVVYYRFAGLVACVALLANLLLTIGFMVLVNATFTLPGLAGLVLMLGMAVDANVLIYERLREERDRGASLSLAIRNGYDRAFPTIIDTHLSSIFTAVVLYVVGNDQLKGFGVSLTAGLVISLFTSLYMTRLLFDVWLAQGWLKKLGMLRFFTRPNIDFMKWRHVFFSVTAALTVVGLALFLLRGPQGLNVDFVGGTVYGGKLAPGQARTIADLRGLLDRANQEKQLQVESVKQLDDRGNRFEVRYADGQAVTVAVANTPAGETNAEREANLKARVSVLPDSSVEQVFLSSEPAEGGKSRFFTVRTTEREPELVQLSIDRLFRDNGQSILDKATIKAEPAAPGGKDVVLKFFDVKGEPELASPGYVKNLFDRAFADAGLTAGGRVAFELHGLGKGKDGRFDTMRLDVQAEDAKPDQVRAVVGQVQAAFAARPQPERLENFDGTLAAETRAKAFYAIVASWIAILLYLWFRFGSWTFGAAAVACLIHDLCFTLGVIAACHYVVNWVPGLGALFLLEDFKIDLPAIAALLTLVGYSVNDTIVVFDRIREVRGKNPDLTAKMINDSVNQTLSRTILAATTVFLVSIVLYIFGGEGLHLFSFVMVMGVLVGTYSSIYVASPLLLIFGEGKPPVKAATPTPNKPVPVTV